MLHLISQQRVVFKSGMKFRCRNKLSFAIHLIINVVSIRELSKESCVGCKIRKENHRSDGMVARSVTFVENHDTGSSQV